MTVAVATVTARVRQITRRDNETDYPDTSIQALEQEAVREISKKLLCLEDSKTGTLASGTNTVTAPDDMVDSDSAIDAFWLNSRLLDPITFEEWRGGKQDGYAYRDGVIYVNPLPNTSLDYTLYYRKYHGTLATNLEFNDDLKMAVVHLTCKKVYTDFELFDKAAVQLAQYIDELAVNAPVEPFVSRQRKQRE